MNPLLIGKLVEKGMDLIDDVFTSDEEKLQAQLELNRLADEGDIAKLQIYMNGLQAQLKVVQAEAESEHWLTANWRPITMLTFVVLIVLRMFGLTDDSISEEEYLKLWQLVEIGLGGYVVSRGAEKVAKVWKGGK